MFWYSGSRHTGGGVVRVGGALPTHPTSKCSDTSWGSYNSTQFWHYLARGSLRSHGLRIPVVWFPTSTSDANCKPWLYFWPMGYKPVVSMSLSLGSINLLEWLTELQEIFYLLNDLLDIKGCKLTTGFPGSSVVKNPPASAWDMALIPGRGDPLDEEMAIQESSILAWRIPWTEEPGGLQSMGSQSRTQLSD